MIITIAGKAGAGKTTLAKIITKSFPHVIHIDLDEINAYLMTKQITKEFALSLFGEQVFTNEELDREKVAKVIYNDEIIYHKWCDYMKVRCEEFVEDMMHKNPKSLYVIEHVLVDKLSIFKKSKLNILVELEEKERFSRVMKRDNLTESEVQKREQFLTKYDEEQFHIIYNEKENEDIIAKIKEVIA